MTFFTGETLKQLRQDQAIFSDFEKRELTTDGLLQCRKLSIPEERPFRFHLASNPRPLLFPEVGLLGVAKYLWSKPNLWAIASLRVRPTCPIAGAQSQFGVPLQRAVEIAMESGFQKSAFFTPSDGTDRNTKLLIFVNRRKESNGGTMELQVWQFMPNSLWAYYVHAESTDFKETASHFDGARISFSEVQLNDAYFNNRKVKGLSYQKYFRLDGIIPIEDIYEITRQFFPAQDLVDEMFEVSHGEDAISKHIAPTGTDYDAK